MSEPDAPPVPTRKQTLAVINQDLAVQLHALGVVAHDVGTNKYICQLDKKLAKKCRQMERKSYLYAHYTSHAEKDEWGDLTSDAMEKLKAALASTSVSLAHLTAPSAAPPKRTRKAAAVARGKAAMEMHAATAQDDPLANVVDSVWRLFELKAHEQLKIIGHIFEMMKARTLPAEDVTALLKKAITSAQHKFTLEDPVYDKLQRILVATQPASFGMPEVDAALTMHEARLSTQSFVGGKAIPVATLPGEEAYGKECWINDGVDTKGNDFLTRGYMIFKGSVWRNARSESRDVLDRMHAKVFGKKRQLTKGEARAVWDLAMKTYYKEVEAGNGERGGRCGGSGDQGDPKKKDKKDKEWKPEDGENGASDVEPDTKQRKRPRKDTSSRGKERCDASGGGRDGARGRRRTKGKSEAKEKPTEQPDCQGRGADRGCDTRQRDAARSPASHRPLPSGGGVRRRRASSPLRTSPPSRTRPPLPPRVR